MEDVDAASPLASRIHAFTHIFRDMLKMYRELIEHLLEYGSSMSSVSFPFLRGRLQRKLAVPTQIAGRLRPLEGEGSKAGAQEVFCG